MSHSSASRTSPPRITLGRFLISIAALMTSTACYVADWSETHVLNPRWPPHAKFHNGQTMSMGLALGIATLWYTWRRRRQGPAAAPLSRKLETSKEREATTTSHPAAWGAAGTGGRSDSKAAQVQAQAEAEMDDLTTAAIFGSLYWVTGLSAILYPGTLWVDPEFGTGAPQIPPFTINLLLVWIGWWLERRRLSEL